MTEEHMYFKRLGLGPMANFIYLLGDEREKKAAVVDPAWEVNEILKVLEEDQMEVSHVFLTHAHPDHSNGVEEIKKKTGAPVFMHPLEKPWEGDWAKDTEKIKHEDRIRVGNLECEFLHTPGHSPGSLCIRVGSHLVSGDTLFVGACGRTDLPGGNPEQLFSSLQMLAQLPDELKVFPGHGYGPSASSTIGVEKKNNPFMACREKERFLSFFAI